MRLCSSALTPPDLMPLEDRIYTSCLLSIGLSFFRSAAISWSADIFAAVDDSELGTVQGSSSVAVAETHREGLTSGWLVVVGGDSQTTRPRNAAGIVVHSSSDPGALESWEQSKMNQAPMPVRTEGRPLCLPSHVQEQ
jgi:hypothetical protein